MKPEALEMLLDDWARRLVTAWPTVSPEIRADLGSEKCWWAWSNASGVSIEFVELWGPRLVRAGAVDGTGVDPDAMKAIRIITANLIDKSKPAPDS